MMLRSMIFAIGVLAILLPQAHTAGATVYGCEKNATGRISKLGTTPPSCSATQTLVSWNQAGGAGASAIVIHGIDAGFPTNPVRLIPLAAGETPAATAYRLPRDGTVANMRILLFSNTTNGNTVVTFLRNGLPTAISATIPSGSTSSIDVPGTVAVLDGDTASVQIDATGVTGFIEVSVAYEIQ